MTDPHVELAELSVAAIREEGMRLKAAAVAEERLRRRLIRGVEEAQASAPRSLQVEAGPSQVGTVCQRRLAAALAGVPGLPGADRWLATIGTAVHAWLDDAFAGDPNFVGDWEVQINLGAFTMRGTLDLYCRESATVIDHKVVGARSMDRILRAGMPLVYKAQLALYALGLRQMGYETKAVALALWPRESGLNNGKGMVMVSQAVDAEFLMFTDDLVNRIRQTQAELLKYHDDPATSGFEWADTEKDCSFCPMQMRCSSYERY